MLLPVKQGRDNPVERACHDSNNVMRAPFRHYCFTIPKSALVATGSSLNEFLNSDCSKAFRALLLLLTETTNKFFESEADGLRMASDIDVDTSADGDDVSNDTFHARVRVYMEYLVFDTCTSPDSVRFLEVVGIRFHIFTFDQNMDLCCGIKSTLEKNAEEKKSRRKPLEPSDPLLFLKGLTHFKNFFKCADFYKSVMSDQFDNHESFQMKIEQNSTGKECMPLDSHVFFPRTVFSYENSTPPGTHPAQKTGCNSNTNYKFAFPQLVYEIPYDVFTPLGIMAVTLPRTTLWHNFPSALDARGTNFVLDNTSRLKEVLSGVVESRNDIRDFRNLQLAITSTNRADYCDDAAGLALANRKSREKALKDFSKVWDRNAQLSLPIQNMIKWFESLEVDGVAASVTTPGLFVFQDNDMSYFGNWVANRLYGYERIAKLSTTHATVFKIWTFVLDAYRYEFKLHNNFIMAGAGQSGKSFILELIQNKLSIPDTVTKVTHVTAKADTVEHDLNDHISMYHEIPASLLGMDSGKSGSSEGDPIFKDKLTSCIVRTDTIHIDPDTRVRAKKSIASEQVGVVGGATNEATRFIPEALRSRFIILPVHLQNRPGFDVTALQSGTKKYSDSSSENASADAFYRAHHMEQMCVCIIEKLIYCGIIPDVDMNIPGIIFGKLIQKLKDDLIIYSDDESTRANAFLRQSARTMTIQSAVSKYFNDEESPAFNKPFSIELLSGIAPLLFATEEISLFVFDMLRRQFIRSDHFLAARLMLKTFSFTKEGDEGALAVVNGYHFVDGDSVPYNKSDLTAKLLVTQSRQRGGVRISQPNLMTAVCEMTQATFANRIIIDLNETGQLKLNAAFCKKHASGSVNGTMGFTTRVFNSGYKNKYTRVRKSIVTGITPHSEFPFVFKTRAVTRDKKSRKIAIRTSVDVINGGAGFDSDNVGIGHRAFEKDIEKAFFDARLQFCTGKTVDDDDDDIVKSMLEDFVITTAPNIAYPSFLIKNHSIAHLIATDEGLIDKDISKTISDVSNKRKIDEL